jgi:hypothetical protein
MWICESTISIAFSPDLGFNDRTMIGFARAINHAIGEPDVGAAAMTDDRRTDLSHLPPSTADEIRTMVKKADIDLPEELMRQFIAAWPAYEAMVRRIPRRRGYAEETAHSYRPERMVRG